MATYAAYRDNGKTNEEGLFKWLYRLFSPGVDATNRPTSLKVSQRGAGANMSVDIAVGDISIDLTDYTLWGWSTAITNNVVAAADATNARKDIVVAYIDMAVTDAVNSNNPGALKFKIVAGTPSATPVDPSGATIQASVGAGNPYKQLARITLPANATTVVDAYIADLRPQLALKARLWGGSSNTSGHVVPNVADDVVLLESAVQGVRNKTFYDPVIDNPTITKWNGWQTIASTLTVASGYNKGQKEFVIDSSADLTASVSVGDKIKFTRGTAPPTRCTSLDGVSQYWSKSSPAGFSFTDDFVVCVTVKVTAYPTSGVKSIVSKYNGTSGFSLDISNTGNVTLRGFNGGSGNESNIASYQSLPLDEWVTITAQLDMSAFTATATTSYIMFDDANVAGSVNRSGSNPTSLAQAGSLEVGARNGGTTPFNGKIQQLAIFNAKVTQATIRDYTQQAMVGNETSVISYFPFDGNGNDLNANGNNLTAQNSAAATTTDTKFNLTEMGFITKITSTQLTVYGGLLFGVPKGVTLSNPAVSKIKNPYGFPLGKDKWTSKAIIGTTDASIGSMTVDVYELFATFLTVPGGSWIITLQATPALSGTSNGILEAEFGLYHSGFSGEANQPDPYMSGVILQQAATTNVIATVNFSRAIDLPSSRVFTPSMKFVQGSGTVSGAINAYVSRYFSVIKAECEFL